MSDASDRAAQRAASAALFMPSWRCRRCQQRRADLCAPTFATLPLMSCRHVCRAERCYAKTLALRFADARRARRWRQRSCRARLLQRLRDDFGDEPSITFSDTADFHFISIFR
jgi:hypothetical protein